MQAENYMTRTARYRLVYFLTVSGGVLILLGAIGYFHFSLSALAVVVILSLVPGRILGFFWRDLLRGLRLLNARRYEESKRSSEQFLAVVRGRPWIKHLVWLGSSSYSRDPEVLALNNLGAAEIGLGEMVAGRQHLYRAIELDGLCPLPFYNLGVLSSRAGDSEEAARFFLEARRLGYAEGIADRIVMSSQKRFAITDGR